MIDRDAVKSLARTLFDRVTLSGTRSLGPGILIWPVMLLVVLAANRSAATVNCSQLWEATNLYPTALVKNGKLLGYDIGPETSMYQIRQDVRSDEREQNDPMKDLTLGKLLDDAKKVLTDKSVMMASGDTFYGNGFFHRLVLSPGVEFIDTKMASVASKAKSDHEPIEAADPNGGYRQQDFLISYFVIYRQGKPVGVSQFYQLNNENNWALEHMVSRTIKWNEKNRKHSELPLWALGIHLLPEEQGAGIAQLAYKALVDLAFEKLELPVLLHRTETANVRAKALARKLRFSLVKPTDIHETAANQKQEIPDEFLLRYEEDGEEREDRYYRYNLVTYALANPKLSRQTTPPR